MDGWLSTEIHTSSLSQIPSVWCKRPHTKGGGRNHAARPYYEPSQRVVRRPASHSLSHQPGLSFSDSGPRHCERLLRSALPVAPYTSIERVGTRLRRMRICKVRLLLGSFRMMLVELRARALDDPDARKQKGVDWLTGRFTVPPVIGPLRLFSEPAGRKESQRAAAESPPEANRFVAPALTPSTELPIPHSPEHQPA